MIIANNLFMYYNELNSYDFLSASPNDRLNYEFQTNRYSLESGLADYLLVQDSKFPMYMAPYRYHQFNALVPDNLLNIFNFHRVLLEDDLAKKTWLNAIYNFEFGQASELMVHDLKLANVEPLRNLVLLREYDNALVIKNFSSKNLKLNINSLPRPNTKWMRIVGMPLTIPDAQRFAGSGLRKTRSRAASTPLMCLFGEKQNLNFVESCTDNKKFQDRGQGQPEETSIKQITQPKINPDCQIACNSQVEFMSAFLKKDQDVFSHLAIEDKLLETVYFMLLEGYDFINVAAGESLVLYNLDEFNDLLENINENGSFYSPIKNQEFCESLITPNYSRIQLEFAEVDLQDIFSAFACNDLFANLKEDVPADGLGELVNNLNFDWPQSNNLDVNNCDGNLYGLDCVLQNVYGLTNEHLLGN